MSICIYSTVFQAQLPETGFVKLLSVMAEVCRTKALAAKRWQDAQAIVFGRHLLKTALGDLGSKADIRNLRHTTYGRPFLVDGPEFNWSHSGDRIVCAVNGNYGKEKNGNSGIGKDQIGIDQIGIDIEWIRPLDLSDFRDLFPVTEWEEILSSTDPTRHFYEEWTGKEAVLKADGRGFFGNIRNVIKVAANEMALDEQHWFIHQVELSEDYACKLATKSKNPIFAVRDIKIIP